MKRIISIIIIIIQSYCVLCQDNVLKFKHLSVHDGLSQSWVRCIVQDSYGYMWFGTGGNGINKYDGYNFTVYKNDVSDKNSLTNNLINVLYQDSYGNFWAGTQKGLNLYDRENDRFVRFPAIQSEFVSGLYETENGKLLAVTSNNIFELDIQNGAATPFCKNPAGCFPDIFVGNMVKDKNGKYWLASANGLYAVNIERKTFTLYRHEEDNPGSISDNDLSCLYRDNGGNVWIGTTNKGLCFIDYKHEDMQMPYFVNFINDPGNASGISTGSILDILDDNNGQLWIGTENGGLDILNLSDFKKGKYIFTHYRNNIYDNSSISNNSIYALYKDDQGTIWAGTYGGGVNYYNKQLYKFEHYRQIPGEKNSLSSNHINALYDDGNDLLIGTEAGLNIVDKKTGKIRVFRHNPENRNSLGSDAVGVIFKDSHNNIWIGTWAGGLNLFDKASGTFKRFMKDNSKPGNISNNNVLSILEDKSGYLWIATMGGGLNRYDYRTDKFNAYKVNFDGSNSISDDWVRTLIISSSDELWISTTSGVDILDRKTGLFKTFKHDTADSKSISYNGASIFFEDSKKNMWIGSEGGLNVFIRKDSSFLYYREEDGLPDNYIKGICEDDHGNLWISTNKGISEFINGVSIPANPEFRNFNINDGLQGNEFNKRACMKDKDGFMYFGGANGYNRFYPDSIQLNRYTPRVVFTDFLIFNKPAEINGKDSPLKKHISVSDTVRLPYRFNVFTIEYAALNYVNSQENQYKYKLERFEKDWNSVGTQRSATYTNLNPGKYIFKVKASNNDGVWNDKEYSIHLIILPPWWMTLGFRISFVLFIIFLFVGFYLFRMNDIKRRNRELESIVKIRTLELNKKNDQLLQQADELNQTNTMLEERQQVIEEQTEELRSQTEELNKMNNTLKKLNTTKDKFFSIIAHDLKNPINSVMGFSELMIVKYDRLSDEKRKKYSDVIHTSVKRIFNLLENLLQWSRSQTQTVKYKPETIDLNSIIDNNVDLIYNDLNSKKIRLISRIPENTKVYYDRNMLNTIIRNLLTNAVKYTEEGEISIDVKKIGDKHWEVKIADSGVGIPEERQKELFMIDKANSVPGTKGESGTGLGLIICKEFIEKNGGTIFVESTVGKGSKFTFTIPIVS